MPQPPSNFRIHPAVFEDLEAIKQHNPDHAERCFDRIEDWERKIQWGRVPQNHLKYLTGSGIIISTVNGSVKVNTGSSTKLATTS